MDNAEDADGYLLFPNAIENGWGNIHVNRFRIHFLAENKCLTPNFPNSLFNYFPEIFSGTAHGTKKNRSSATKHNGSRGGEYVQFNLNIDSNPVHIAGQLRDDWVRVGWKQQNRGFSVDTMAYIQPILQRVLEPNILPPIRYHFLCGRRSWVIFKLKEWVDWLDPRYSCTIKKSFSIETEKEHTYQRDETFVLETAAIERFSGSSVLALDAISNDLREDIVAIWSTLLENFVDYHNLTPVNPPENLIFPLSHIPSRINGNVHFQMFDFANTEECKTDDVTLQIQHLHPYLEQINLHYELANAAMRIFEPGLLGPTT